MATPSTPTRRNVEDIARLEQEHTGTLRVGERVSVAITNAAGTPACAALHLLLFAAWMLWNVIGPQLLRFDPYPFGLLTMGVSMEGVILAVFVLITQNRMSAQSDRRDHLDLQVDLLAEQEMTVVLRLLGRIADHLGIVSESHEEEEAQKLMENINVYELMEELRRKFP